MCIYLYKINNVINNNKSLKSIFKFCANPIQWWLVRQIYRCSIFRLLHTFARNYVRAINRL